MTIPVPPVDPIEDPTAPDMAVSSLHSSTRDVPPSTYPTNEKVEQPLTGRTDVADRQDSSASITCDTAPAAGRTSPTVLSRYYAHKANAAPIDTPYSLNPTMEPGKKPTVGAPLRVLTAVEARCCEVWVRAVGTRAERAKFVALELKRKYDVTVTEDEAFQAADCRAGRRYRKALYMKGRKIALRTLSKHTSDVVDDYLWSRKQAKDQLDYKEVRLAAVDHLDRLGITLKRDQPQQQAQIIVLKGSNFDVATLDTPTPEVLATEILQDDAP
jgi:hypothetical protein